MGPLAELKELYAYNQWANARILDAVGELSESELSKDLGSSYPSVRATAVHLFAAEWIWVSRWQGISPESMPEGWADCSVAELRRRWRDVEDQQRSFLGALREVDLDRVVDYTNIAGEPLRSSIQEMLRHVVNHASYHRGQVVTMLRQLGKPAPATDLILYYRTAGRAGNPSVLRTGRRSGEAEYLPRQAVELEPRTREDDRETG